MSLIDDMLVAAGIVWLVVRQFQWRDAARMPRVGAVLLGIGVALLAQQTLTAATSWTWRDGAMLAGEVAITVALGAVMGGRYRLRPARDTVLARLEGSGVALWGVFVLVRLASFAVAHALGAGLVETSGALLVVFGANRLVTGVVVQRRVARPATAVPLPA